MLNISCYLNIPSCSRVPRIYFNCSPAWDSTRLLLLHSLSPIDLVSFVIFRGLASQFPELDSDFPESSQVLIVKIKCPYHSFNTRLFLGNCNFTLYSESEHRIACEFFMLLSFCPSKLLFNVEICCDLK